MNTDRPYRTLGEKIKDLRVKAKESLQEVSSALELDLVLLDRIEEGRVRPSEETLLMLADHLGAKEEEINKLWETAGYKSGKLNLNPASEGSIVLMINDARIIYTDSAVVNANENGVIINFMQSTPGGKPMAISRVGMSREHARRLFKALWHASLGTHATRRQLPPGTNS